MVELRQASGGIPPFSRVMIARHGRGSDADYTADADALLGGGMQLRFHYFARWLGVLNGLPGLKGCSPYNLA